MTKQELITYINEAITSNGNNEVTGAILRNLLTQVVNDVYPVAGSNGTIRMKKHSSLTSNHIGLLAMQEVTLLNQNPQSIDDFQIQVKVADTIPMSAGTKGEYEVSFSKNFILTKVETKIIRVTFTNNQNPLNGMQLAFSDNSGYGTINLTFKTPFSDANQNEIFIGNTLSDTLDNLQATFTSVVTTLSSQFARIVDRGVDGNGFAYVDFEMHWNVSTDTIKYAEESVIDVVAYTFQGGVSISGLDLTDEQGETVAIVLDVADGDGNFPVIQIGGTTINVNGNSLRRKPSGEFFFGGSLDEVTSWGRTSDGNLIAYSAPSSQTTLDVVFTPYLINSQLFNISVQRALDIPNATIAKAISDAYYSTLWSIQSWDTNQNTLAMLTYGKVFRNDEGQPNGTFGAFGLKYFADDSEVVSALIWALGQSSNFSSTFDVLNALHYDGQNLDYRMTVRTKTAPSGYANIYSNNGSINNISINFNNTVQPISKQPERINNAVIGVIVGVDGTDVLISTATTFEVTMVSAQDGAMGIVPLNLDDLFGGGGNYVPYLIAWRGGKVIDFGGYYQLMQDAGFSNDNTIQYPLIVGGMFRPLSGGIPDGKVIVDSKFLYFGN